MKITLVDDSHDDIQQMRHFLDGDGHQAEPFTCPLSALAWLSESTTDLVVLDLEMPELNGLELANRLRQIDHHRNTPILFVSGVTCRSYQGRALREGANAVMEKPLHGAEFSGQVAAFARHARAMARLREQIRNMQSLAYTDSLTGVGNRHCLDLWLAERGQALTHTTLIFIDINDLKFVNDTYGHLAGDEQLRQLGQVLRQSAQRADDLAIRLGGDELALLLPKTDKQAATVVARRILSLIADLPNQNEAPNVSVAISIADSVQEQSFDELYRRASDAVLRGKMDGASITFG